MDTTIIVIIEWNILLEQMEHDIIQWACHNSNYYKNFSINKYLLVLALVITLYTQSYCSAYQMILWNIIAHVVM